MKKTQNIKLDDLYLRIYKSKKHFNWLSFLKSISSKDTHIDSINMQNLEALANIIEESPILTYTRTLHYDFKKVFCVNLGNKPITDSEIIASLVNTDPPISKKYLYGSKKIFGSESIIKGNSREWWVEHGYTLNIEEVCSVFKHHLKDPVKNILWPLNIFYIRCQNGGILTLEVSRRRYKKWPKDKFDFRIMHFDGVTHYCHMRKRRVFFGAPIEFIDYSESI